MVHGDEHLELTRRQLFGYGGFGLGGLALGSMLHADGLLAAPTPSSPPVEPLTPKPPHHAPRAKSVIFLFMAGGPSQLELFDFKPKLRELEDE